ncbi:hypothetical protein ACLOJK_022785 [Asimina triloba]
MNGQQQQPSVTSFIGSDHDPADQQRASGEGVPKSASSFRIQPDPTSTSYLPLLPVASMTHAFEQPNPPLLMGFSFQDPATKPHHEPTSQQWTLDQWSVSGITANRWRDSTKATTIQVSIDGSRSSINDHTRPAPSASRHCPSPRLVAMPIRQLQQQRLQHRSSSSTSGSSVSNDDVCRLKHVQSTQGGP